MKKYLEAKDPEIRDCYTEISECIPLSVYFDLFNTNVIPKKEIDEGGYSKNAFAALGCEVEDVINSSYFCPNPVKSFLGQDDISDYALTAGTRTAMPKKIYFG